MLDDRFVDEYKKIKPAEDLKYRIMKSIDEAETPRRKPAYIRLRPVLSGAIVCMLLVFCFNMLPFKFLEGGNVSVYYAQSGELIAPEGSLSRVQIISEFAEGHSYDVLDGIRGAEFAFTLDGNTEISVDLGRIYLKTSDGGYKNLGNKFRIDGDVTLFWAFGDGELPTKATMGIKNRSFDMALNAELRQDGYTANLMVVS